MEYLLHILILVAIYSVMAMSLDLLVGHGGFLSLAQAAFYGLGAYTSVLISRSEWAVGNDQSFLIGVLVGMVVASAVSLVVSLPSLRLHDDYFVLATFGFQMILFSILNNWMDLTRGPLGISGISQPVILGCRIDSNWKFLLLAAIFALFAYYAINRLTDSPFGRVLRSIREDEVSAQSQGKRTLWIKVAAFAVSAALAAMAGGLYAHYISYIDPTSFTVMESILVISMVIIGGAGSKWGPVLGAVVLVTLPEVLRFVGMPNAIAANMRQIIYGLALVACMLWRPQGLIGEYAFGRAVEPK